MQTGREAIATLLEGKQADHVPVHDNVWTDAARKWVGQGMPARDDGSPVDVLDHLGLDIVTCGGGVDWQPSEVTLADGAADSINAWANWAATGRMRPAIQLDVEQTEWPIAAADAIVCINMVHISLWQTTKGLLAGAARILDTGGVLYLYGPYLVEGTPTAAGNLAFDEDLRRRNPEWGLRTLEAVAKEAAMHGLVLEGTHAMPSNNLSVVFRRQVS